MDARGILMHWRRTAVVLMIAMWLPACAAVVPKGTAAVPFQVLLNNHTKIAWKPASAQTEAFLFLNEAKDLAAYPIAGTSDPFSSPFPPAELGQVDFAKEVAVFLTRGVSPQGPSGLEISGMNRDGTGITVKLKLIHPGDKASTIDEFRVTLVKIPREALPSRPFKIHFVDEAGKAVRELEVH
jgi:hypothetical protein